MKIWGVHEGDGRASFNPSSESGSVGVDWAEIGDLTMIDPSREAFRDVVGRTYLDASDGAKNLWAGHLYRFAHLVKPGDLVVYPVKRDRQILIGEVAGPYLYNPEPGTNQPHQHAIRWLRTVPRTRFTQGALYEIGSPITLFKIKNYASEVRSALLDGAPTASAPEDPTVQAVAEEIEQSTRDFVLKQLGRELRGHPFAHFVATLLEAMGYRTRISPAGIDGGVDIIAHRDELGFEPPIIKVQVKSTEGAIGDPVVSQLYGKVGYGEFGLFVTLGTYTTQARAFAKNTSNLRLLDGDDVVELVLEHYEALDSRYRGLLPLKRVYIPVGLGEES